MTLSLTRSANKSLEIKKYVTLPKKDESDEENLPDQQKDNDDSKDNTKQTQTKTLTKINRH